MSDKNKETEMLRASLIKKVSELNDNEIILETLYSYENCDNRA